LKKRIQSLYKEVKELSPTLKGFLILAIILIIGIVLRWEYIISEAIKGFSFFAK